MGALTSNRKRGDEFFKVNQPPLYYNSYVIDSHISKKPRLSSALQTPEQPVVSSNKIVSRLSRYPDLITKIRREVHAPCRVLKFGSSKRLSLDSRPETTRNSDFVDPRDAMGGLLSKNYNNAKEGAFGVLRYFPKEKEVIDVDNDPAKELITEDSSVEEVEVMEEDGREWRSVVSGQTTAEAVIGVGGNAKGKIVEEHSVVTDLSNRNVRVKNLENMVDSLSLDREIVDVSNVEVYKKLLESAEKRTSKLKALEFEIEYNEKKRSSLQSLRLVKKPQEKPVEEFPRDPFISLTEEEENQVDHAFLANRRRVLATHGKSGIEITGQILQCLRPGAWLNDEVINLYLELLKERELREPEKFLRCHFFNTFFYKKLISGRSGYEYRAVKRWTTAKKLGYGLIECDKIFVPIHKEIHWCLAIINKKDKKFQYLDSLGGKDRNVLRVLAKYFVEEVKDKSGLDVDVSSWEQQFVEDLPEQENGFDCGVFMIKYADFYSRGLGLCFNQEHMPYFRKRTAKEILNLRAD
ncbi:ubiquitin-like-specific protease ESD4 [Tripterygium wilfordii]|uniref:ubiquitin-like-specific protease ESD4 n=1 Tax=Tripterygium wilfordii TaxID=458696 RepID=UPI0018F81FA5|nr:ubiquitin-like-specific protease ESD4 [Tripterygium wilfordii]